MICQDVSHVDILYPFVDNENVIFCRPDLSDLADVVRKASDDDDDWRRIGRRGQEVWEAWGGAWRTMFKTSFEDLVH